VTTLPWQSGSLSNIRIDRAADPESAGACAIGRGSKSGGLVTTVLELRDVSKIYGTGQAEVAALRRVNLTAREGELVAIMGPSGSGKSSLLTIAGSLEEPTSGEVMVLGTDLSSLSPNDQARLRRRRIGYVFQDFNLLAGFTAIENVTVPLELDGTSAKAAHATGMKALAELGIAERAHHFPDELSGGERQRVAIARAVVGDRKLLLADEPTGALDSVNAAAVMQLMLAICRRGVAGVVVTHDAQMASCADRVVLLQDGQVIDQAQASRDPDPLLADGTGR
jgi:putative ABC transport system ATP-binding protein